MDKFITIYIKKYNNTIHSTIGVTPNIAKEGNNNIEIWLNINEKASFNRKYPPLKVNDNVRVYIKRKSFSKSYDPRFTKEIYKVLRISEDGKQFLLNNNTRRLYSRHELKKVNEVQTKDS